jgi:hypothetical protein
MEFRSSTVLFWVGLFVVIGPLAASGFLAPPVESASSQSTGTVAGIVANHTNATVAPDGSVNPLAQSASLVVSYEGRPDGHVAEYDINGGERWKRTPGRSYLGVQKLGPHRVFYAWKRYGQTPCGQFSSPCTRTGVSVYNVTSDRIEREWSIPVRARGNREIHDAEYYEDGRIAVMDMAQERLVVLNEADEIIWQWNASNFYNPPADVTKRDWLHINDVDRIAEERYMLSVRNSNQLLIVDRQDGVVEVVNKDHGDDTGREGSCLGGGNDLVKDETGDVICGDPSVMNGQHNPQWLGDGRILVADSINDRATMLTRQPDGDWEVTWEVNRANGIPLDWPRDTDLLPGGHVLITDSLNDRVVVVNRSGDTVWTRKTAGLPYEADLHPYGEPSTMTYARDWEGRSTTDWNETDNRTMATTTPAQAQNSDGGDLLGPLGPTAHLIRNGASHVAPVPYWVSDWHVLTVFGGLFLMLFSGVFRWRTGR